MTLNTKDRGIAIGVGWWFLILLNIVRIPSHFAPHVKVEKAALAPLTLMARASGNLEARKSVILKSMFEGRVLAKKFREGQVVKAGEFLLEIDREKIRLDYQSRRDALSNARSDLARAQKDLRIQKSLFKQQAVAYSAVEDAQRAVVRASQALHGAEQVFKLEEERWNSNVVTAPFTGTVVRDNVGDGLEVAAGQDLLILADVSEFTVRARVDELDIKQVREGQRAEIRVQIFPKAVFGAKVIQVGTAPDEAGIPSMPVILKLEPVKDYLLRPRMSADVRIVTGKTAPLLSVPMKSVNNTDGNVRVWGLTALNRLTLIPVTLDRSNPERVEVVSGIKVGQKICKEGLPSFRDGLKVIVDKTP
jgi:RND family efflux transporter MFP subunit